MDKKEQEGVILVIICALVHAAQPVLGKYVVSSVSPLFFASVTNLIAAASLILIILYKRESLLLLMDKKYFFSIFMVGFFGTTLSNILFFYGVRLTSGINTAILLQVESIYAMIIGYFFLNESISSKQIISTLLIIFGTSIVIYHGSAKLNLGDILILLTPFCYQAGHFFSKRLLRQTEVSPLFIATGRTLYGGIILFALNLFAGGIKEFNILTQPNMLGIFIFFGTVVYALSYVTFLAAIKRINLSKATAIISAYPSISIILAYFILKESVNLYQLSGFAIIMLGVFYLLKIKSELR